MEPIQQDYEFGLWNGKGCKIRACMVEINRADASPMHWCNAFVGTQRQAIEVEYYENKTAPAAMILIDNNNGTGYYKVTKGGGAPNCPHASLGPCTVLQYVPKGEVIRLLNKEAVLAEDKIINEYQQQADPIEYQRLEGLRAQAKDLQTKGEKERARKIGKLVKTIRNRPYTVPGKAGSNITPPKKKRNR